MKSTYFIRLVQILILLSASGSYLFSQPYYLNTNVSQIRYIDSTTGWMVGRQGIIRKTIDSGDNWQFKLSGTLNDLYDVAFKDENNGVVTGASIILATSDGGEHWNNIATDFDSSGNSITVSTSGDYYICGQFGFIIKSTDNGFTWEKKNFRSDYNLYAITFVGDELGFVAGTENTANPFGKRIIFKTTDGGDSWSENFVGSGPLYLHFLNKDFGTALFGRVFYRTTNGGDSWIIIKSFEDPNFNGGFHDLQFLDEKYGVTLHENFYKGVSTYLYYTIDGGLTWKSNFLAQHSFNIHFASREKGNAWGDEDRIYRTNDSATTWYLQSFLGTDYASVVNFLDTQNGFLTGTWIYRSSGIMCRVNEIFKTTDAGVTWKNVSGLPTFLIKQGIIEFYNKQFGITATGAKWQENGPDIYRTLDGGLMWTVSYHSQNPADLFNSATFIDSANIIVVGNSGVILKSSNKGDTWDSVSSGVKDNLMGISFNKKGNGIIVGDLGNILESSDGGNTWKNQVSYFTTDYKDVKFISDNRVLAIGESGTILISHNGGSKWSKIPSGTTRELTSISFADSNLGCIVGLEGMVLRTVNGGLSWAASKELSYNLNDVSFLDKDHIYIAGDSGLYVTNMPVYGNLNVNSTPSGAQVLLNNNITGLNTPCKINTFDNEILSLGFILKGYKDTVVTISCNGIQYLDISLDTLGSSDGNGTDDPESFNLSQNYPNPFNSLTTIRFSIPEESKVLITIYDALGREITRLVDEKKSAGNFEIIWDASHFISGVYFCRMHSGDHNETKKLTLLK